ncbi:GNAT family N-acetyltransferase [Clostridium sp. AL.422]|uniref:GNAT family N-acetyltransferase n=1 Tax=Clostridium TaxID=1485 RepID=UPI00293DDE42|nr:MULTISPECIES: GNAT family N-acetyltransferase [unclassified Clostridium]MDV4150964.1 GNAT family N-acetyltransferase [Clostridium sp. AL.422]
MEEILKLKNKSGNVVNVRYKVLDLSYIDEIIQLQENIMKGLEDKQWYAPTEREEFIKCINNGGKIIGYIDEKDDLIAMAVYVKKGYEKGNYGYDLDLKGEELLKVAQVESTVVRSDYRGNGLQLMLCKKIEDIAKYDSVKLLASTASPYNKYSVNTFEKLGYEIKKDKIKYGGLRRYILAKEI